MFFIAFYYIIPPLRENGYVCPHKLLRTGQGTPWSMYAHHKPELYQHKGICTAGGPLQKWWNLISAQPSRPWFIPCVRSRHKGTSPDAEKKSFFFLFFPPKGGGKNAVAPSVCGKVRWGEMIYFRTKLCVPAERKIQQKVFFVYFCAAGISACIINWRRSFFRDFNVRTSVNSARNVDRRTLFLFTCLEKKLFHKRPPQKVLWGRGHFPMHRIQRKKKVFSLCNIREKTHLANGRTGEERERERERITGP